MTKWISMEQTPGPLSLHHAVQLSNTCTKQSVYTAGTHSKWSNADEYGCLYIFYNFRH